MLYIRTPREPLAHGGAPGDTVAICLSFVSSYKTQSALHVICQRPARGDRYRVQEDLRYRDTRKLRPGGRWGWGVGGVGVREEERRRRRRVTGNI